MSVLPRCFGKKISSILLCLFSACFFLVQEGRAESAFESEQIDPGDTLNVLFLRRDDLLKLPTQGIVFSFVSEKDNKPTMHGWVKKKSADKPDPAIKLGYGCVGEAVYQTDINMGEMVLTKKQVKNLRKQLEKAGTEYLIFKPVIENKNLRYEVLVSSELPSDKSRLGRAISTSTYVGPSS